MTLSKHYPSTPCVLQANNKQEGQMLQPGVFSLREINWYAQAQENLIVKIQFKSNTNDIMYLLKEILNYRGKSPFFILTEVETNAYLICF